MQADPFVQAPMNLQNYNAYSYVLNNPLSYTDPSGYLFKGLHNLSKKINRQFISGAAKVFGAELVSIVGNMLTAFCGPAQAACAAAWNYEFTRAMGGSSSQAFKAGLTSAMTASIGGKDYGSVGSFVLQGLVGGVAAEINGGNFGHGFWAAGLNSAVGGSSYTSNPIANAAISAVVGGTISKITGGKFRNGAYSSAFSAVLTADWGEKVTLGSSYVGNLDKELESLSYEQKAENYKQNLKHFENGLKAVNEASGLDTPHNILVVDRSEINGALAAVKCSVLLGCGNDVYISEQYLQSGRSKYNNFLATAYHETLHFNDSRWNIWLTGSLERVGIVSARHQYIYRSKVIY
ncbi:hypothetical protein N482_24305 [Pseudoalteromonas luteoviolacea NCIMB 1942]|uniref:DUF637 domain-containing protein n=2 Tax=Pseudoalteromonas luteoviolacea TaxID=43657 RepID=A0A167GG87_9GAMM|nr:hypothetical protein N482_24305 [Pseudoalteromonas luteoviolacea NCIMB 1942]